MAKKKGGRFTPPARTQRKIAVDRAPALVAQRCKRTAEKVVVAYPHPHEVSARFQKCLLGLVVFDGKTCGHIYDGGGYLANSSGANIVNARNEIVEAFLDHHDADWLCFIDTDMVFDGEPGEGPIAGPDLVHRLLSAADPVERPIVGALCFALLNGQEPSPTLYGISDDLKVVRYFDYPRDELVQVGATGTGCLLIHRSVFEKIRDDGRYSKPYVWFEETRLGEIPVGEDITFCIRAGVSGFPVFVDTRIKVGHEKPFVVGEEMFDAWRAWKETQPAVPTYVVIPTVGADDPIPALPAVAGALVIPNDEGPLNLSAKWNAGLDIIEKAALEAGHAEWNVAILNDDLELGPECLERLARGLRMRDDYWIAYPDLSRGLDEDMVVPTSSDAMAGQTMTGFCFMVRGEARLRCDERFAWWYGDSDLERQVRSLGKQTVCVGGAWVSHFSPMQSTRGDLLFQALCDETEFAKKWGLDRSSLWLARHPEWCDGRA